MSVSRVRTGFNPEVLQRGRQQLPAAAVGFDGLRDLIDKPLKPGIVDRLRSQLFRQDGLDGGSDKAKLTDLAAGGQPSSSA